MAHRESHGFGLCVAELLSTREPVGCCGLIPRPVSEGLEGELAWMFAKPWWGCGLATEAGGALIRFGLEDFGLRRVFATAYLQNAASLRVMEKLGMKRASVSGEEAEFE